MENNEDFNRIMEMNTEAERRKIATQAMCAMMANDRYAKLYGVREITSLAVVATDALIAELNKKKDGRKD